MSSAARTSWRCAALCALALLGAFALDPRGGSSAFDELVFSESEQRRIAQHSPLPPAPPEATNQVADDPRAIALGRSLFFDERLSGDGTRSCASCHEPRLAFTDGRRVAEGAAAGRRNTPALWNVAQQRWYFWDGRADTLWSQALGPIESDIELDGSRTAIVHTLRNDAELARAYGQVFGDLPDLGALPARAHPGGDAQAVRAWNQLDGNQRSSIDRVFANVGKALAAYQRQIVSNDSRFDRFAARLASGDATAGELLSQQEQRGLRLFVGKAGCRTCHSGANFSDGEFHALMLPDDSSGSTGSAARDPGRWDGLAQLEANSFNAAGPHSDDPEGERAQRLRASRRIPDLWGQFKTPSLRNVDLTAPYMHAGQFASLEDVLHFYNTLEGAQSGGHHQETVLVPLGLSPAELADLAAFLRSLSDGAVDPQLDDPELTAPELTDPQSTDPGADVDPDD